MKSAHTNFEKQINDLINKYGKQEFLKQALEKQKVTRQLINTAKFKLTCETIFFTLIGLGVILFGLSGLFESKPAELTFIIPVGIVMLWAVRNHSRKVNESLFELSKLAVGTHAKKLANNI